MPASFLTTFAQACRDGRYRGGEWQGDGWGVAWLADDKTWIVRKSLHPIWEDTASFDDFPAVRTFAVHARSASFDKDKGDVEFNQPYISAPGSMPFAYTFNGLLRGVGLPRKVAGRIGAQRIWTLLQEALTDGFPEGAMADVVKLLSDHTRELIACNIGLMDAQYIYAITRYSRNPGYYQLRWHRDARLRMVCSEPLPGYDFQDVPALQVFTL